MPARVPFRIIEKGQGASFWTIRSLQRAIVRKLPPVPAITVFIMLFATSPLSPFSVTWKIAPPLNAKNPVSNRSAPIPVIWEKQNHIVIRLRYCTYVTYCWSIQTAIER